MKPEEILKQEWEDVGGDLIIYNKKANREVISDIYGTNISNHLKNTHNFTLEISEKAMDKPLLEYLRGQSLDANSKLNSMSVEDKAGNVDIGALMQYTHLTIKEKVLVELINKLTGGNQ